MLRPDDDAGAATPISDHVWDRRWNARRPMACAPPLSWAGFGVSRPAAHAQAISCPDVAERGQSGCFASGKRMFNASAEAFLLKHFDLW